MNKDPDIIPLSAAQQPESDDSFRQRICNRAHGCDKETATQIMLGCGETLDKVGRRFGLIRHPRAWC